MREKMVYVADDGKEFGNRTGCEVYDASLMFGMHFFDAEEKEINAYPLSFEEVIHMARYVVVTDTEAASGFLGYSVDAGAYTVFDCSGTIVLSNIAGVIEVIRDNLNEEIAKQSRLLKSAGCGHGCVFDNRVIGWY